MDISMDISLRLCLSSSDLGTLLFANTAMVSASKISKHLGKPPLPRKRPADSTADCAGPLGPPVSLSLAGPQELLPPGGLVPALASL